MTVPVELIQLAGFSSLFEVAVGINLVFSTWDALRDNALNKLNIVTNDHKISLQAKIGDTYDTSRCSVKFESKVTYFKGKIKALSIFAKWVGLIISALLLTLLTYLGFNPDLTLEYTHCLLICIFSVLPSVFFLLIGQLYVKYASTKLESFMEQQKDAVDDWETVYGNVMK